MNAIVIEHVQVAELPQAWRDQLGQAAGARVTVRIEAEQSATEVQDADASGDSLFGMWRDREDMADVSGYIRDIRAPRFGGDQAHDES